MKKVIKKTGKSVFAYRLGESAPQLGQLIRDGKIIPLDNGTFEIFSQEALRGGRGCGQIAKSGDYIKIDNAGYPYPNDADFFSANHRHISGDEYEQIPKAVDAWMAEDAMCEEMEFLLRENRLVLNEDDPSCYFSAELWGTKVAAAKDAVLIFYHIERDKNGAIKDVDFNFVVRDEFEKSYRVC